MKQRIWTPEILRTLLFRKESKDSFKSVNVLHSESVPQYCRLYATSDFPMFGVFQWRIDQRYYAMDFLYEVILMNVCAA